MSESRPSAGFLLTKGNFPGKSITIIFNGEDVSYKCSRAFVSREQGIPVKGWVEMKWDVGMPPDRYDGEVMWRMDNAD